MGTEHNVAVATSLGDDPIRMVIINDRRKVSAPLDSTFDPAFNIYP
jgi:hypothetical protein